jgi:hypothetical protein
VNVGAGFVVNGQHIRTGIGEGWQVFFGFNDHQMNIQGQVGDLADGFDDAGAKGDVRDELTVHDIHMDPIGTGLRRLTNLIAQLTEVCGKN